MCNNNKNHLPGFLTNLYNKLSKQKVHYIVITIELVKYGRKTSSMTLNIANLTCNPHLLSRFEHCIKMGTFKILVISIR